MSPATTWRPRGEFDSDGGEARLKQLFGVATLDGFGQFSRAGLAAAGGLVAYLDHTARGSLPFLRPPRLAQRGRDDGDRRGHAREPGTDPDRAAASARAACSTRSTEPSPAPGARLLAADIGAPLLDRAQIEARLDLVAHCHDSSGFRESLRATLRSLPDIGRALGRLAAGRGGPRDLGQLRDGLDGAWHLAERLGQEDAAPPLLRELVAATRRARRADRPAQARAGPRPADRRQRRRLYRRRL